MTFEDHAWLPSPGAAGALIQHVRPSRGELPRPPAVTHGGRSALVLRLGFHLQSV